MPDVRTVLEENTRLKAKLIAIEVIVERAVRHGYDVDTDELAGVLGLQPGTEPIETSQA